MQTLDLVKYLNVTKLQFAHVEQITAFCKKMPQLTGMDASASYRACGLHTALAPPPPPRSNNWLNPIRTGADNSARHGRLAKFALSAFHQRIATVATLASNQV